MPLYEYQCLQCGTRTEHLQKISDPPLPECPKCGGGVKKLISSPAFQFKGSGWYATDYAAKGGGAKSEASSSETKSDGGKSDGGKSEGGKSEGGKSEGGAASSSETKSESKNEAKPDKKETATPKGD